MRSLRGTSEGPSAIIIVWFTLIFNFILFYNVIVWKKYLRFTKHSMISWNFCFETLRIEHILWRVRINLFLLSSDEINVVSCSTLFLMKPKICSSSMEIPSSSQCSMVTFNSPDAQRTSEVFLFVIVFRQFPNISFWEKKGDTKSYNKIHCLVKMFRIFFMQAMRLQGNWFSLRELTKSSYFTTRRILRWPISQNKVDILEDEPPRKK